MLGVNPDETINVSIGYAQKVDYPLVLTSLEIMSSTFDFLSIVAFA